MNTDTGEIRYFSDEQKALLAGFDLPLTKDQAAAITPLSNQQRIDGAPVIASLNRHERRKQAALARRAK